MRTPLLALLLCLPACAVDGAGDPDLSAADTGSSTDAGPDTDPTPSEASSSSDTGAPAETEAGAPDTGATPEDTGTKPATGDKKVIAYFAEWAVYGRNFHVPDVDGSLVTHLNYAFLNVTGGECAIGDSYAALDKAYPGDTWDAGVLRGSFHQLQLLKAKHPKLRVLLSIGGWTWSDGFSAAAATDAGRSKLAKSCAAIMNKYGFDGLDVDWEYPGGGGLAAGKPEDTQNFTKLLAAFRAELGAGKLLSIAAPAGPAMIKNLELAKIHGYLDSINVMSYDFHGAWEKTTGHNSPLFRSAGDPSPAGWDTDAAVKAYLDGGVPAAKIVLGGAFYGRGWSGVGATANGLFQPATGASPGTYEAGVLDFHDLAANYVPKYKRYWDPVAKAPWLYDAAKQIMISYDDAESLGVRGKYIVDRGLGGMMIWELSSDDKAHTLGKAVWASLH